MAIDLLLSANLIDRVIAIENAYSVSRIMVLQSLPGNPVGIEVRPIGDNAVALMAKNFPNPNFNRAHCRGGQGRRRSRLQRRGLLSTSPQQGVRRHARPVQSHDLD